MCNEYRSHVDVDEIREEFSQIQIRIEFPEGAPNLEPRDSVRITDGAPIVRMNEKGGADLVQRRWSWPDPRGKPVFNFRSDGREFKSNRCLIVADGFYEFTPNPKSKIKHKWLFTLAGADWFCIAGIWRRSNVGEAFTMLTTVPGDDVKPYHDRQIVVLERKDWRRWLDARDPAKDLLAPPPGGALKVKRIA